MPLPFKNLNKTQMRGMDVSFRNPSVQGSGFKGSKAI